VLGSAAFDNRVDRYAEDHQGSTMDKFVDLGNALPVAALGLSALFAFDDSRPQLSDAGAAALEAGALAFAGSELLKAAVSRERPDGSGDDAFPSRRSALMWAAVTPYAKELDMPWLYGVAALTNAARVGSREHWLSDTVAGSVLGYALGHLTWEARRASRKGAPRLALGPQSVALQWDLE
jgi:membrane-associated phospholipid phosphatase